VNVRVIAATHRDLVEDMRKERFREDLYYRLNVFPIRVPPLRERPEDIPALVWAFLEEFSSRMGKKITQVPRKTMEALQRHPWPGNVRELRNVISTLRIVPSLKQHSGLLEILRSVLGPTEAQPGCLSCHIYEEEGPDHATVFCAHWETEVALQEHIRSDFYRRILVACELSNRPPEVCFHHISRTQGMDLIQQIRGRSGENLQLSSRAPTK